jgi:hypothetical protein
MHVGSLFALTATEYLDSGEASVLAFHNDYAIGMQGGIELIQHDVRVATNGFLFCEVEPGRMSALPGFVERTVDRERGSIEVTAKVAKPELEYRTKLEPDGDSVLLSVELERSLEEVGSRTGFFSLCLYPPSYWGKSFASENGSGVIQRAFQGRLGRDGSEHAEALPLAKGKQIVIAPEAPELGLTVAAEIGELELVDPRHRGNTEWLRLRQLVDPREKGTLIRWRITPQRLSGWLKPPMIAVSQIGYHPAQDKRAIIELDRRSDELGTAKLLRIDPAAGTECVLEAATRPWGEWLRYRYAVFDFTSVREPGTYLVEYAGRRAGPFRVAADVYREGVWQPTLHTYFPVQMCHMAVYEGDRLWHAACHLDDAMQVPAPLEYFDGYRQCATPETGFEPYQHVPHLDRGGWHDAGDTDLATGSQAVTTHVLCLVREEFGAETDQTSVNPEARLVKLGEPDGVPDIVEQVKHGVECLLGGYRAFGRSATGIIDSNWKAYVLRGETSRTSDNLVYDATLAEDQVQGDRSGRRDDRFVFTNHDTAQEYQVTAALAAASRVLRPYFPELADEALATAEKTWRREQESEPSTFASTYVPRDVKLEELRATVELFLTTDAERYRSRLLALSSSVPEMGVRAAALVVPVLTSVYPEEFRTRLEQALEAPARELADQRKQNPFGVVWKPAIWGIGWDAQQRAFHHYYLHKAFPRLFPRSALFDTLSWVLGCHPGNSASFVSGVGAESVTVAFGINRADYSHIPGGNVSGTALIKPDFPELKLELPYLWQQSEYVMSGAATYIFLVLAVERVLESERVNA